MSVATGCPILLGERDGQPLALRTRTIYHVYRMSRLLLECGEALYGQQWQSALARDLGVSDRTVRRWVAGGEPPPGVYVDLLRLTQERAAALDTLAPRLRKAGA